MSKYLFVIFFFELDHITFLFDECTWIPVIILQLRTFELLAHFLIIKSKLERTSWSIHYDLEHRILIECWTSLQVHFLTILVELLLTPSKEVEWVS